MEELFVPAQESQARRQDRSVSGNIPGIQVNKRLENRSSGQITYGKVADDVHIPSPGGLLSPLPSNRPVQPIKQTIQQPCS